MNKSTINVPSAGTEAEQRTNDENQHVSQHNANTNVVDIPFVQCRQIKFLYIFKTGDGRYYKEVFTLEQIEYGALSGFLSELNNAIIIAKCQFTGQSDKNDTDIYEGSILKGERYISKRPVEKVSMIFYVVWDTKASAFKVNFDKMGWSAFMGIDKPYEVIGNIYENPELLWTFR